MKIFIAVAVLILLACSPESPMGPSLEPFYDNHLPGTMFDIELNEATKSIVAYKSIDDSGAVKQCVLADGVYKENADSMTVEVVVAPFWECFIISP